MVSTTVNQPQAVPPAAPWSMYCGIRRSVHRRSWVASLADRRVVFT
eukprot:SAG22_NODE_11685_length_473_cov_233.371658_2_plen_45_part_01